MSFLIQPSILFVSSLVSFGLIYYKFPISVLQQVILGVLIVLIILLDRFFIKATQPVNFTLRLFLLFLISLSVQVLILSTGGFYSPFLILFHLFAIALSFLIDLKTATSFLIFSIVALIIATLLDPILSSILSNDYASVALYLLSFMVIIPLSRVIATKYHLKDALSKILTQELKQITQELKLTQIRQESVLEGLSDIVLITDTNLKILSFNEATERELRLSSSELIDRPLLEVLILKGSKNQVINRQYLSIDQAITDKTTRIIKNLFLYVRNTSIAKRVKVQVRPTGNLDGVIDQIAFIISDAESVGGANEGHQNLQEALLKHEAAFEDLKNRLLSKGLVDLQRRAELFGKAERDILTAMELHDHGLKPVIELKDVAQILPRIISVETMFTKTLGVELLFKIDEKYIQEASKLIPPGGKFSAAAITSPFFTAPIDSKWFDILVQKLLEVSSLLVSGTNYPQVQVLLTYDKEFVYINFAINSIIASSINERFIFTEYYGVLGMNTNLRLGSGLEGYMAKTVTLLLGIPLNIKLNNQTGFIFTLKLSKKPHI